MENINISVIHTGNFKLDGGAMFGVVPKQLWNKWVPADEWNLCNWAMRCLLVEDGDKKILIDTGIGSKQSEKFFSHYHLNGNDSLENSLQNVGVKFSEITDVILTHLHFDHCGGAVVRSAENHLIPAFPNAKYWVTELQWKHALNPNPREKASFLTENFIPLQEHGLINFAHHEQFISEHVQIYVVDGHTKGMICPIIKENKTVFYGADLFPSAAHIPVNYVMGYDIEPLITMQERAKVLQKAIENNWIVFFEHDAEFEASTIALNEKGAFYAHHKTQLSILLDN